MRTRVEILEQDEGLLCKRLSPLGRHLRPDIVAATLEISIEDVWNTLSPLVDRNLVRRADGRYEFVHDTVWERAYETMSSAERKQAHFDICERLQRSQSIEE